MSPAIEARDRYVFDGRCFWSSCKSIPPTEMRHISSTAFIDLANLNPGEEYDFSYSLRDGYKDTITTYNGT